jgi:hypothetical protein
VVLKKLRLQLLSFSQNTPVKFLGLQPWLITLKHVSNKLELKWILLDSSWACDIRALVATSIIEKASV